jgi:hypothetical protein
MKWTLLLSYCLRVSLLICAGLLVMFDSWAIALAIIPVLVLDYYMHRTSTRKVMMGLFVMLLLVQVIVLGILGIKFMLFEEEESFFLESLKGPDTGHDGNSFVNQMKATYTDISSGKISSVSGVNSLRHSASKAILDRAKSVHHSLGAVDKTLPQYLHVTDLISLFGEKGAMTFKEEDEGTWQQQKSSTVIHSAFGVLPNTSFSDLRPRATPEVRAALERVLDTLPASGFSDKYLNPCWETEAKSNIEKEIKKVSYKSAARETARGAELHCLPAFYLLGQPKSGTTDLYSRLVRHHDIHSPKKKEVSIALLHLSA